VASHTSTRQLRRILVAGAITAGAVVLPAAPAMAAPITIPGVGTFEIPEIPGLPPLPTEIPGLPAAPAPLAPQVTPAAKAVQAAESKIGSPYVYGATGPDSFDCSGLTSYAYAAAGVSLPRSSGDQAGVGTPVSRSELKPGDLVFFYSPISHVGLYIGGGKMVHARTFGQPVAVTSVDQAGYNMAVRLL
jgi:hypothetical protein